MEYNQNTLIRLKEEFKLCSEDIDLCQIGCNFALNQSYFNWNVSMIGPTDTPYENGLFRINIIFPSDYPNKGPEFKFENKIYHLNVDMKNDFGHICINNINQWRTTGKVKNEPDYNVKRALFDIFSLFFKQGTIGAYDEEMAKLYMINPKLFNENAKQWTMQYAK